MTNRQFKGRSLLRIITRACKHAQGLLKLWSKMHPSNRKQFPTDFVGTVQRSVRLHMEFIEGKPGKVVNREL